MNKAGGILAVFRISLLLVSKKNHNYRILTERLQQRGYFNGTTRVELVIREVGFEDGSALYSGTLWVQDPNNPNDPTKKIRADKIKAANPNRLGIGINDIVQSPLSSVGASGTPTLLLIDNRGAVVDSWVGKLTDVAAEQVRARVSK